MHEEGKGENSLLNSHILQQNNPRWNFNSKPRRDNDMFCSGVLHNLSCQSCEK